MTSVLITGTSSGLGLATAQACLKAGMRVLGVARRNPELGNGYTHLNADLASPTGMRDAVDLIRAERPWALVNNAAWPAAGLLLAVSEADVTRSLEVNLTAPALLCRAAARTMAASGHGGRIVNVSSVVASRPPRGLAVYAAAKAGLEALTVALAKEVAPRGVMVNAISPGYLPTEMTAALRDVPASGSGVHINAVTQAITGLLDPACSSSGQVLAVEGASPWP